MADRRRLDKNRRVKRWTGIRQPSSEYIVVPAGLQSISLRRNVQLGVERCMNCHCPLYCKRLFLQQLVGFCRQIEYPCTRGHSFLCCNTFQYICIKASNDMPCADFLRIKELLTVLASLSAPSFSHSSSMRRKRWYHSSPCINERGLRIITAMASSGFESSPENCRVGKWLNRKYSYLQQSLPHTSASRV